MPLYAAYQAVVRLRLSLGFGTPLVAVLPDSGPERWGKRPLAEVDCASTDKPTGGIDNNSKAAAAQEEGQPRQTGVLALADFAAARDLTRSHQRLDGQCGNSETL